MLQMVLEQYIPVAMIQYLGCTLRPPAFALINGSGNSRLNLAVALLDGVACRIGLSILLGVTFAMGINGFWYGNAISGCVPFVIGFAYLLSGRWKAPKNLSGKSPPNRRNPNPESCGEAACPPILNPES